MFNEHVQSHRSAQRAQTRARVVDTAARLFRAGGFRGTTIRQIAGEAGVSVGTVMAVGDKDVLLLEVYDRWIGDVHRQRTTSAGSVAAAPESRIGELVQPFLDLFDDDLDLAREYAAIFVRGKHSTAVFGALAVRLTEEFAEVFRSARIADEWSCARSVYLAYLGLLMATATTGSDMSVVRAQLQDVARLLLRGPRSDQPNSELVPDVSGPDDTEER